MRRSLCQARNAQVVISDQGTVFVSKFMKDLYDLLQIKANASTPYHPQTDGQMEQVNQEVENTSEYSSTIFKTTGSNGYPSRPLLTITTYTPPLVKAPSRLTMAITPHPPRRQTSGTFSDAHVHHLHFHIQKIHEEAKRALEKAADQMKAQYDKKKQPAVEYQVGDKVWLNTTNLSLP